MISSKPCSLRRSTRNSITGLLMMGIIGLGTKSVRGRTRVPLPAARIIAFIAPSGGVALDRVLDARVAREDAVETDDLEQRRHWRLHVGELDVPAGGRAPRPLRALHPPAV